MKRPLLLDLFCGAGGGSMGYHRAGFDVVGVDLHPQKNYPFQFVQADALDFLRWMIHDTSRFRPEWDGHRLDRFDAIHASPPCQRYSVATSIKGQQGRQKHPDLLEPTRIVLEASRRPFVIENVIGAPMKPPAILLCGMMFGLRVLRHRYFETNWMLFCPPHRKHPPGHLTHSCRTYDRGENQFVCLAGNNFVREVGAKAMGVDWPMTRKELSQAIPPAYTEYIGKQLIEIIRRKQVNES